MHRELRGHYYTIKCFVVGGILLASAGCSFVKVPQGWVFSTGWSLEFHRMPFNASCERPCETTCATSCNPECGNDRSNTPKESIHPAETPEPAPALRKVGAGEAPEPGDTSGLMNLLKRRGRLGVCSTCGKLGRFKEPQPAVASTEQPIPKFHPVPAGPVFCPQPIEARAVNFQPSAETDKSTPANRGTLPPKQHNLPPATTSPEVVPPPPPSASVHSEKAERAPREFDLPPEPPEWVFTAPNNRSEQANKGQSPTKK